MVKPFLFYISLLLPLVSQPPKRWGIYAEFLLKELFEICSDVIYQSDEGEDVRGVLKVAKALIMHTSYADGNHFSEEDKLYELADEFLGGFYEENGIEQLYDIDDAEY